MLNLNIKCLHRSKMFKLNILNKSGSFVKSEVVGFYMKNFNFAAKNVRIENSCKFLLEIPDFFPKLEKTFCFG